MTCFSSIHVGSQSPRASRIRSREVRDTAHQHANELAHKDTRGLRHNKLQSYCNKGTDTRRHYLFHVFFLGAVELLAERTTEAVASLEEAVHTYDVALSDTSARDKWVADAARHTDVC